MNHYVITSIIQAGRLAKLVFETVHGCENPEQKECIVRLPPDFRGNKTYTAEQIETFIADHKSSDEDRAWFIESFGE